MSLPDGHGAGFSPREQAWIELADLFRDTEMTARDAIYIAGQLRALGFDAAVARKILEDEVAPVLGWNLLSVAGNWTGWPDEVVVGSVREWLARRNQATLLGAWHRSGLAAWLRRKLLCSIAEPEWRRVAAEMQKTEA